MIRNTSENSFQKIFVSTIFFNFFYKFCRMTGNFQQFFKKKSINLFKARNRDFLNVSEFSFVVRPSSHRIFCESSEDRRSVLVEIDDLVNYLG